MTIHTLDHAEIDQVSGAVFSLALNLDQNGFAGACHLDTPVGTLSGTLDAGPSGILRTFNYTGLLGTLGHTISLSPAGFSFQNVFQPAFL